MVFKPAATATGTSSHVRGGKGLIIVKSFCTRDYGPISLAVRTVTNTKHRDFSSARAPVLERKHPHRE